MNNDDELLELYEERVDKYIEEKQKTDDLYEYVTRLEERIEKAIDYINSFDYILKDSDEVLIKILKGEENE